MISQARGCAEDPHAWEVSMAIRPMGREIDYRWMKRNNRQLEKSARWDSSDHEINEMDIH